MSSSDIFRIVRLRGFNLISESENKEFLLTQWKKMSSQTEISSDLFPWLVVLKHRYVQYLI